MIEQNISSEKKLIQKVRAELRPIENINHQLYCVKEFVNSIYQAVVSDRQNACAYVSGVHVCNWALEDVQQKLDKIYTETLQILRDYE